MTFTGIVESTRQDCTFLPEHSSFEYLNVEKNLAKHFKEIILDSDVSCSLYGDGKVTNVSGENFGSLIIDVTFADSVKRYSLLHIMTVSTFLSFVDKTVTEQYMKAYELHTDIEKVYKEAKMNEKLSERENEKAKVSAERNREKLERLKERLTANLNDLISRPRTMAANADEFYYSLGWLAKNIGTMTATLPDFLSSTFTSVFGSDVVHKTISSAKKTSNGNAMQWTFSFKATLRNSAKAPAYIIPYLSSTGKALTNTAFIWDLAKFYGFQFGKNQDVEQIKQNIPVENLEAFENGFNS